MKIFVIGAGSWGTALAVKALVNNNHVALWTPETFVVDEINNNHTNRGYLPHIPLPENLHATSDMSQAKDADYILLVIPAQGIRSTLIEHKHFLQHQSFVICSKGFEQKTHFLMHEVVQDVLPDAQTSVLAGPNFAHEVAKDLPASFTIASHHKELQKKVAHSLGSSSFRAQVCDDMVGIEVCSSFKNILAIACGVYRQLELGENAVAALMTQGIHECNMLIKALGGSSQTILTMGGIGDIILTCSSPTSRNTSFGIELAKAHTFKEAIEHQTKLAEGIFSTPAVFAKAEEKNLHLPTLRMMHDIICRNHPVAEAVEDFMSKPLPLS